MMRAKLSLVMSAGLPERPPSPVIKLEDAPAPSETAAIAAASVKRSLMSASCSLTIAQAPIVFGHCLAIARRVGIRNRRARRRRFARLGGCSERLQLDLIDELHHHIRLRRQRIAAETAQLRGCATQRFELGLAQIAAI